MKRILAVIHCWWWHLVYGMWLGYRETYTYDTVTNIPSMRDSLIAITSTDSEYRVMKTFWTAT